jgi:regulator of cell morphogenesis and NO signaling
MKTLDINGLPTEEKSVKVLEQFHNLDVQKAMVVHSDADPKDEINRIRDCFGEVSESIYLQTGPKEWIVEVLKKSDFGFPSKMGALAVQRPESMDLFRKYHMDYCCKGERSIYKACAEHQVDPVSFLKEFRKLTPRDMELHPEMMRPGKLAKYINQVYHDYARERVPVIFYYFGKVMGRFGDVHPELKVAFDLFKELTDDLAIHMQKEEQLIFGYVDIVEHAVDHHLNHPALPFGTFANPIHQLREEHSHLGDIGKAIEANTRDFDVPSDADKLYETLIESLHAFIEKLYRHMHLENNVLFPMVIELEEKLLHHK